MSMPYVVTNTQDHPQPLKFVAGDEKSETITIYADTVALDGNNRRLLDGGTLVTKITSGAESGKYGPYSKTAADGRASVSEDAAYIVWRGHDLTRCGDKAVAGLFADCVFDKSELTLNGATLATVESAFPQCVFSD